MGVINGLLGLLGCQLAGEVLVRLAAVPIPGPVLGMVLLFGLLQWRRPDPDSGVLRTSDLLLRHLQLFFVPAGVGIVTYAGLLRTDALPILGAIAVSWAATLAVVGLLMSVWVRRA